MAPWCANQNQIWGIYVLCATVTLGVPIFTINFLYKYPTALKPSCGMSQRNDLHFAHIFKNKITPSQIQNKKTKKIPRSERFFPLNQRPVGVQLAGYRLRVPVSMSQALEMASAILRFTPCCTAAKARSTSS
uniref:Putative secreted protein n=1 Tax=Ixodes ricinus TaxID=34613 RepID=A0A6B0US19_IXORI